MFHQYISLVVFKYRVLESGFLEVKFHPAVYIRLCLYVKMLGISFNDKKYQTGISYKLHTIVLHSLKRNNSND